MANNTSGNPLIIDTAGAGDILAAAALISVQTFAWVSGASAVAGDAVSVTDSAGREVFAATAIGANNPPRLDGILPRPLQMAGLRVVTLVHGKLYVYLEAPWWSWAARSRAGCAAPPRHSGWRVTSPSFRAGSSGPASPRTGAGASRIGSC